MKENKLEALAQDAAILSICELGLGALLHSFHVPLAGYFLSLNQIFLISRSTFKTKDRKAPYITSSIAACFKTLSPAGKKLTPILAISTQGFLFSIGTIFLGANLLGTITGSVLSSVWSFLQPLLIYYFIFGSTLIRAIEYFYFKIQENFSFISLTSKELVWLVTFLIFFKAIIACVLVFIAYFIPESYFHKWQYKLINAADEAPKISLYKEQNSLTKELFLRNIKMSFQELINPLFIFSLLLTLCFFFFVEGSLVQAFWYGLRTITLGFLLFFFIKYIPLGGLQKRFPILAIAIQKMHLIKNK